MASKMIEKACISCGIVRLCENRKNRQLMCKACRRKPENVPSYRGAGKTINCADCGKPIKTWPSYEKNGQKPQRRCLKCNTARYVGSGNPHWKGGVTPANQRERRTRRYADWRKSVFERDQYKCQECGQVGGQLHADHIRPFAMFPEHRFDIDNGRTLCVRCHMLTPSFLGGARKLASAAKRRGPMLPFMEQT